MGESTPNEAAAWVHPTAVVDDGAVLGAGTKVWHFVHVCATARIGARCVVGQNAFVAPDVTIGDGCKLQNNVSVYTGVTLEDEVFVGPSAVFTNVLTPRAHVNRKAEFSPTLVKRRASIGANATIVCGVTLGEGSFVAAGAVVTKDVPPYVQVQGAPARPTGFRCDCGAALDDPVPEGDGRGTCTCRACGASYRARADGGLDRTDTADGRE